MSNSYPVSNQDRNVSASDISEHIVAGIETNLFSRIDDLRDVSRKHLAVTEIFSTIQGEMPYLGTPAIFVRLAGCNRGSKESCLWCDTEFSLDRSKIMNLAQTWQQISESPIYQQPSKQRDQSGHFLFRSRGTKERPLVVLTGGEPALQTPQLFNLFRHIKERAEVFPRFQFETNGDYLGQLISGFNARENRQLPTSNFTIVVSPKAHPTVGYSKSFYKQVVKYQLAQIKPTLYFRVLVADDDSHYSELPAFLSNVELAIPPQRVFLSPLTIYRRELDHREIIDAWSGEAVDFAATRKNFVRARKLAVERGFRLSMQSHLWFEAQ